MDGWNLVNELQRKPAWSRIPVVATTGDVLTVDDLEPFSDRLETPIEAEKLIGILERTCT